MAGQGSMSKQIKDCLKRRTILEKCLMVFSVVVLLCLLGLAITLAVKDSQVDDEYCVSLACLMSATEVLMWTDSEVDPCDDFYNYTCNKWINDAAQSEDSVTRFSNLEDELDHQLKALLESEDPVPDHFRKARLFYKSCMDTEARKALETVDEFMEDLHSISGYPALSDNQWNYEDFNYISTLRKMRGKGSLPGIFIAVDAELDLKNNSRQLISISQTTLGLRNRDYYTEGPVMKEYLKLLVEQATYLCKYKTGNCPRQTEDSIHSELARALEVEKHLAKLSVPSDDLNSKENIYNVMQISDLQDRAPGIIWLNYTQIYYPEASENDLVMVHTPEFMVEFSHFIRRLSSMDRGRQDLANYLMYRHTLEVSRHLTWDMAKIQNAFPSLDLQQDNAPGHWAECVTQTKHIFDLSLASIYAQKYFPTEKKEALEDMVNVLRETLAQILKETSWMEDKAQEVALLKIDKMHVVAGYPDGIMEARNLNSWYGELNLGKNYYDNYKRTSVFHHSQPWLIYKKAADRKSWRYLPGGLLQTSAFFNNKNNTMFIPLGIAQDWFFNKDSPKFLNYARMGFLIAREMAHAFDAEGSEFDEQGNWHTWWTNTTEKNLAKNSKCMVDMFNNYYVPQAKKKINGKRTLSENMADDLGAAAVHMAYATVSSKEPDAHLPGIDLSPNQLFWVNLASMWCEKHPDKFYEDLVKNAHHSPARYRMNSTLSNSNDFAQDFDCRLGSSMNKNSKKCHVWR